MPTSELFRHRVDAHNLHGVVHLPDAPGPRPAVVVCHGFKGFMDWGFFPYLCDLLSDRGFVAIRFNLSGAGMQPGDNRVTDLEAFRTATFSKDVAELESIVRSVGRDIAPGVADPEDVSLLGHSRGGGIALLVAAECPVRTLVTWSAVSTFERMGPEEVARWRETGSVPILNARTGQQLELGVEVLEDLQAHRAQLDLEAAARKRTAPWLIVHGDADETVPFGEAEALARAGADPVSLLRISGASHTFGVSHPFDGPSPHLVQAMNATQSWFRRRLE